MRVTTAVQAIRCGSSRNARIDGCHHDLDTVSRWINTQAARWWSARALTAEPLRERLYDSSLVSYESAWLAQAMTAAHESFGEGSHATSTTSTDGA